LFTGSVSQAASYQKIDGTIVDPILYAYGPPHSYSGNDLEPNAYLSSADLRYTNMQQVDLSGADLRYADLRYADLRYADLRYADLLVVDLGEAKLTDADLTGLDLTSATLTGANLHQALLPSAMPSLPLINGAVVKVQVQDEIHYYSLAVSGSVQVDTGGILSVTADSFTAAGVNMQGGIVAAAFHGLDLDEIGNISGHGRLFGDVEPGTDGAISGSGAGLTLYGDVSGSGSISGTSIFGNVSPGSSAGQLGLTDVLLSSAGTLNLEIGGTDTQ
jgi:hypothetical protein